LEPLQIRQIFYSNYPDPESGGKCLSGHALVMKMTIRMMMINKLTMMTTMKEEKKK